MTKQLIMPRATDENSDTIVDAVCYVYEAGTTTPLTTYTDVALSVAHSSPIAADGEGVFASVFYDGSVGVKVDIQDGAGVSLPGFPRDYFPTATISSSDATDVSFSPVTGNTATDAQTAIANNTSSVNDLEAAKIGSDAGIATGTAGTADNFAKWDANGDLVDGGAALIDEDNMASDSATAVPTQQSVKAYVDASANLTADTEQATTSGTTATFFSLPAGITEIVMQFNGVSLSGTDNLLVQIGDSGGMETTGYNSASGSTGSQNDSTEGFIIRCDDAADALYGNMTLIRMSDGNTWTASHGVAQSTKFRAGGGAKALSAELDRIRIKPEGSDTFDAGAVNIVYR